MCIKLSASVCLLKLEALILDSGFETRVEKPMETSSLPGILIEYYLIYFLLFFFLCGCEFYFVFGAVMILPTQSGKTLSNQAMKMTQPSEYIWGGTSAYFKSCSRELK